jgi:hypothetical protein
MDPLSISASIAGLLTLTQSILALLADAKSWRKDVVESEFETQRLDEIMRSLDLLDWIGGLRYRSTSDHTPGTLCSMLLYLADVQTTFCGQVNQCKI